MLIMKGFDKSMGKLDINRVGNKKEFNFKDSASGKPILNGHMIEDDSIVSQILLLPEIIANMGVSNLLKYKFI